MGTTMTHTNITHGSEVSIRDLSKSFAINSRPLAVLKGLNFNIRACECLVIVSASVSGKTRLLRVLESLETAESSRILLDGKPLYGAGTNRAVIFREPRLLP